VEHPKRVRPDRRGILRCEPGGYCENRCECRSDGARFAQLRSFAEGGERRERCGHEQRALNDSGWPLREPKPIDADQQRAGERERSGSCLRSERAPNRSRIRDDQIVLVKETGNEREQRREAGKARETVNSPRELHRSHYRKQRDSGLDELRG
jgi:hypothetical protein